MAQIIQKITVEVSKPNFFQAIVAKQYDSKSRFLEATLVQNGEKIDVSNTSTVTINAKRNDGAEKSFNGETNTDGTVTVPLTYWMLELDGTLECDISILDADLSKLTTTKFIVEVERAACQGGDVTDSDKYDIMILQGQNIVGSVNGKTGVVDLVATDIPGTVTQEEYAETKESVSILSQWVFGVEDHVIEEDAYFGTSRRWKNGISEWWLSAPVECSTENRDGENIVLFEGESEEVSLQFPSGSFAVGDIYISANICGPGFFNVSISDVSAQGFTLRAKSDAPISNETATINILAKGRWE